MKNLYVNVDEIDTCCVYYIDRARPGQGSLNAYYPQYIPCPLIQHLRIKKIRVKTYLFSFDAYAKKFRLNVAVVFVAGILILLK